MLKRHAVGRGAVIGGEQFFFVIHFVDVLPAAAGKGLQNRRAADVIEQLVPIDGIVQIVQRFGIDVHIGGIGFLRQQDGFGNGDAQLRGYGVVEKFVVGGPPEGIVDYVGALQRGVFQIAAVIFHFVGNAVDDDAVFGGLVHSRAAQFHKLGGDSIGLCPADSPSR